MIAICTAVGAPHLRSVARVAERQSGCWAKIEQTSFCRCGTAVLLAQALSAKAARIRPASARVDGSGVADLVMRRA